MRHRVWAALAAVVVGCLVTTMNAAPASAAVGVPGPWTIMDNWNSRKGATVESSRDDNGAPIQQDVYRKSGGSYVQEQLWTFTHVGNGMYSIRSAGTPDWKALSINNGSHAKGARAIQWTYHGGRDQLWYLSKSPLGIWRVKNVESGQCLAPNGAGQDAGVRLIQWPCGGGNEFGWSFQI